MRKSIGRMGGAILSAILPEAKAQACTEGWCETCNRTHHRCCKLCPGGKVCTYCGYGCPGGCVNY